MFEAHVLHLLQRYLGEYVNGLSTEALRISVWKDLKLKAEALNSLKLPDAVKSRTITLKVHMISSESGLTVRTKLHSLKIKDELQHQQSGSAQHLAYSVLKNEDIQDSPGRCDSYDKEISVGHADDEDAFTDALSEFLSPTEPGTPAYGYDSMQHYDGL